MLTGTENYEGQPKQELGGTKEPAVREAICARCDRSLAGIASGQPCPNCGSTGRKGVSP